jgi:hypothetical protein
MEAEEMKKLLETEKQTNENVSCPLFRMWRPKNLRDADVLEGSIGAGGCLESAGMLV